MGGLREPKDRTKEYYAGQLHAAVGTLQLLSGLSRPRMFSAAVVNRAVTAPSKEVKIPLFEVGKYLDESLNKSEAHRRAATEIHGSLPELLHGCGPELLDSMKSEQGRVDFRQGLEDQLSVYRGDALLARLLRR